MAKATSEPKYRVEIKKSAQKVVAKAPREIRELLTEAMRGLANNPRPHTVEKMKGQKETYYRIPVRDWRIIYTVEDDVLLVLVVQVGPRKDIYRDF